MPGLLQSLALRVRHVGCRTGFCLMRLFSLFTSITHTFFIYLQQTAEEQKSFSSASEAQNTMDAPRP
jgi:hypothetical protein